MAHHTCAGAHREPRVLMRVAPVCSLHVASAHTVPVAIMMLPVLGACLYVLLGVGYPVTMCEVEGWCGFGCWCGFITQFAFFSYVTA